MRGGSKKEIAKKLREQVAKGIPLTGAGAGVGLSAKCAEEGGADLIIIYNSGRFRMAGQGSSCGRFSYSNANEVIFELAEEVFPMVKRTPIIAGVLAIDPYINMEDLLHRIKERGFSGVQNFPTVGNIDIPIFSDNLQDVGMGYAREVEMTRLANQMDLLTTPYCFNEEQARLMAATGTDIIVAHMGLTAKGMIGAGVANSLDECADKIKKIAKAAKSVNPEVMIIGHGGTISEPEDAQYIYDRVPEAVGFYGASSAERLPTEKMLVEIVREYKSIQIGGGACAKS